MNTWICPNCGAGQHGFCSGATWLPEMRAERCACKLAGHEVSP